MDNKQAAKHRSILCIVMSGRLASLLSLSSLRSKQPLFEIAESLGKLLGVRTDTTSITKTKQTLPMKDVGVYSERVEALTGAFTVASGVEGKAVLLIDDLFQSGATMTVAANAIKAGKAKAVYALALTRTRS